MGTAAPPFHFFYRRMNLPAARILRVGEMLPAEAEWTLPAMPMAVDWAIPAVQATDLQGSV
jgi:hypothetical protein